MGGSEGDAEDRVGAELRLGGGAVQLEHRVVNADLVASVVANEGGSDLRLHVCDRFLRPLAEVTLLVAVAQLDGLVLAGGSPGRNCGAAEGAADEAHVDLDGRIASGVDDLTGGDGGDGGVHG